MNENELTIKTARLSANPDEAGWSQSYDFAPEDKEKFKLKGHLYAVIATKTQDEGLESVVAGRELLARLHEEYFAGKEDGILVSLKNAVQKVIDEFSSWEGVEIVACVYLNRILYFAVGGGSSIQIYRDGNLIELLGSKKSEVKSASGKPKNGDIYILATNSFFNSLPAGVIKAALSGNDPQNIVDVLAPQIHSKENIGNTGAVFLTLGNSEDKESLKKVEINESLKSDDITQLQKETLTEKVNTSKKGDLVIKKGESKRKFRQFSEKTGSFFKKFFEKKVYVGSEDRIKSLPKQKRVTLSVGVILLTILSVSIYFGVKQKKKTDFIKTYEEKLISASHSIDESLNLFSLNPVRSRELFQEGRGLVLGLTSEGIEDKKLDELKMKIDENEGKILGEYHEIPELLIDLSLLSDGFNGDEMVDSNGVLYILDISGRKVASVEIASKRAEVVAGPIKVGDASNISSYSENVFVANKNGITEVVDEIEKVIDKDWEGDILINTFAGNIYLIDKSLSYIWRYPGDGKNFGDRKNWLSEGTVPNLTNAIDTEIDGNIWVLKNDGKILKFSLGNQENFSLNLSILTKLIPASFYLSEETEFIYILDQENSQVAVFDKEGNYFARYLADEIGSSSEIVVSESEKKLILLTGDKLLAIELKHF